MKTDDTKKAVKARVSLVAQTGGGAAALLAAAESAPKAQTEVDPAVWTAMGRS